MSFLISSSSTKAISGKPPNLINSFRYFNNSAFSIVEYPFLISKFLNFKNSLKFNGNISVFKFLPLKEVAISFDNNLEDEPVIKMLKPLSFNLLTNLSQLSTL